MAEFRNPIQKGKTIKDDVSILVGSRVFDGWESVRVSKNLESIANSFSIGLFDKFEALRENWPIKPGEEVNVIVNQQRLLTGYIEKLNVRYTDEDRGFTIMGRSKAGDLVDCMHEGENEFKNTLLIPLAQQLVQPFGIKVLTSVVSTKIIDKFVIKPGETVFEAIDRAARLQGYFFISTREGNIRLTESAKSSFRFKSASGLEQGVNILEAVTDYDASQRHNKYIVKGQAIGLEDFFGEDAATPKGEARDFGMKRHRPLELIAEGSADPAACKKRAEWEMTSRLGRSIRVTVSVQGWTKEDGSLWEINEIITVKSQFLGINRQLLSIAVEMLDDALEGKVTNITLVDPQAYNTKPLANISPQEDIFASLGANFE